MLRDWLPGRRVALAKVDAQGLDVGVVRSAGSEVRRLQAVQLEVVRDRSRPRGDGGRCDAQYAAEPYATEGSNPRLAGPRLVDRVPGRPATHTCEPRLGQRAAFGGAVRRGGASYGSARLRAVRDGRIEPTLVTTIAHFSALRTTAHSLL